jgi:hypothetical protein
MKHIQDVIMVNAAAMTAISMEGINTLLTILSLLLAIGYTLYKWKKELKK